MKYLFFHAVTICLNVEVIYTGNRQLSSIQESALGTYKYVGTSKNDTGGSGDPVYMKIQDDSDIVSIIHKYDIYGWLGWQCQLVSRSFILRLMILISYRYISLIVRTLMAFNFF